MHQEAICGTTTSTTGYLARVFVAALSLVPVAASAHETWLLPSDFSPATGASVGFQISSGMGFPAPGSAIAPERIVDAALVAGERQQALRVLGEDGGVLELQGTAHEGVNCAWVQLRPRILEIPERGDVEHYLEEIGASDAVWDHWKTERDSTPWRESYAKLARSYLRTGAADADSTCIARASEARFDIQPLQDPTRLAAGDTLGLRVLFDDAPLSGQAVAVLREGDEPQALQRSDAQGRLEVTLHGAGRYMVYATHLRPASAPGFNWESDFVTLTFVVGDR